MSPPFRICMGRPAIVDMIRACQRAGVPRTKIVLGLSAYYGVSQRDIMGFLHKSRQTRPRRVEYRVGADG